MSIDIASIEKLKTQVMKKCKDRIDEGERRASLSSSFSSRTKSKYGL